MSLKGSLYKYLFICLSIFLVQNSNLLGHGESIFASVLDNTSRNDLGPKKSLFKVDHIKIEGLKKVEKEAILEKITAYKGLEVSNYTIKTDIERIYKLKYFDFVEAHHKVIKGKNHLIYKVKEKPIVGKISLVGNSEIDDDDLNSEIKTKEFSILDINTIKNDVLALEKHYEGKGFYLANIKYELKKIDNENVELVFNISEFDKVRVKKIIFLGNKAFSNKELKNIMETREDSLFSFMSGAGNFKEFNFQTDIERLKYFYKTKGHLLVNVGVPEITVSEDKKWVFITIKVNEGPSFTVNRISYDGEILFSEDKLKEKSQLLEGETYSEELLRKDIQKLTEMYQDKGYAFANVLRHLDLVPGENKVNISFSFEKGKMAYFGKISVVGNTKTRDKVVRRELKIKEGVKFSGTDLRVSKENVSRLGFFEPGSVVFNTISRKGQDDILDIEIHLKEKNTGQISLGAGYSTATKFFLQSSITQNNFLGRGQTLSFSLSLSGDQKTFNLGFTEPYAFDSKWTLGGDIFKTSDTRSSSYSFKKHGFDVRVGHPIFEYTRLFVTYKLENTDLQSEIDPTIQDEVGEYYTSSIRTTIMRDKRNHRSEPTKGYYLSYSTQYAGLGGDKKWFKNEFDARYFKRVWGDLIFRSRLFAAKIQSVGGIRVPRSEKLTLGGSRNLRGYSHEGIGPHKTVDNIAPKTGTTTFNAGGNFATYTTLELEHPLAREAGLKWVLFFDAGEAIGLNDAFHINMDYGFGFRWFSPIGVLRFEFGYPINPKAGERGSQFHFDIGQLF